MKTTRSEIRGFLVVVIIALAISSIGFIRRCNAPAYNPDTSPAYQKMLAQKRLSDSIAAAELRQDSVAPKPPKKTRKNSSKTRAKTRRKKTPSPRKTPSDRDPFAAPVPLN